VLEVNGQAGWPVLLRGASPTACCVPMLRPSAYLTRKLLRPLPTKDGGVLRTVTDARTYMLGLSKARELRAAWQRACELLLAEADIAELSKAVELALFYDARLGVKALAEDHEGS